MGRSKGTLMAGGSIIAIVLLGACAAGAGEEAVGTLVPPTAQSAPTVPQAPQITSIDANESTITISFAAPASDGGSSITGYDAACEAASSQIDNQGTTSPIQVGGALIGVEYQCVVHAMNSVGSSAPSPAVVVMSETASAPEPEPEPVSGKTYETSDLGWEPGEDVSSQLRTFIERTLEPNDTLIIDDMYRLSGSGYTLPDGVVMRGIAADQSAGFISLDGVRQIADANDLPFDSQIVFEVGENVRVENLYFTQPAIDLSLLVSGGTKSGWFGVIEADNFQFVGNKVDTKGWVVINAESSDHMIVRDNTFDSPKYGLLIGEGQALSFTNNFGTGGYEAPSVDGTRLNKFMDVIKVKQASTGPQNAIVSGNVFVDLIRDAIDTTGGFADANVFGNVFVNVSVGLDLKSLYDQQRGADSGLVPNTNINISENAFFDSSNSIVTTTLFRDDEIPDLDLAVQGIHSANNMHIGGGNGFLVKFSKDIYSIDDYFASTNPVRIIEEFGIQQENIEIDSRLTDNATTSSNAVLDVALEQTGVTLDHVSAEEIQIMNVWFMDLAKAQRAAYLQSQQIGDGFIAAFSANDQILFGTDEDDDMQVGNGLDVIDMSVGRDTARFVMIDPLVDVIRGFDTDDIIDLRPIITNNEPDRGDVGDFVSLQFNGTNTELQVRPNGISDRFVTIAKFDREVSESVEELFAQERLSY